jgi:hypothetical protein
MGMLRHRPHASNVAVVPLLQNKLFGMYLHRYHHGQIIGVRTEIEHVAFGIAFPDRSFFPKILEPSTFPLKFKSAIITYRYT